MVRDRPIMRHPTVLPTHKVSSPRNSPSLFLIDSQTSPYQFIYLNDSKRLFKKKNFLRNLFLWPKLA